MDTSALIQELGQALSTLATKVKQAAAKVRPTAFLADNTDKVGGNTVAALRTQMGATLAAHTSAANPHGDTAAKVGIPLKATVDAAMAALIPSGILPVSSFGSKDYLPPNVSGSYEGGTTASSPKVTAALVESDGTLMYLRNGTNGARSGVFYAYLKNAEQASSLVPVRTNKKYQPAYFPDGYTAAYLTAWSDSALLGRLQDANGNLGNYFLSITNGTFDDSKHVGVVLSTNPGSSGEVFVAGNQVYFYQALAPTVGVPVDITVKTIPLADVLAGTATAFSTVTGITTNGFSGSQTADAIRLASVTASANAADKPLILINGTGQTTLNFSHFENPGLSSVVDSSGVIRTKWLAMSYASTLTGASYKYCTFTFTYNPVTKTAALDAGLTTQNSLTLNGASVNWSGPIYALGVSQDGTYSTGNGRRDMCITAGGYFFQFWISQTVDTVMISRQKINNFTSRYESIRYNAATTDPISALNINPSFGSAIGGYLVGCYMVSPTKLATYSGGQGANGNYQAGIAVTNLEGASDAYTHKSINNGSYLGFAPNKVRAFLADQGIDASTVKGPVVEVDATGVSVSCYNFCGSDITGSTRREMVDENFVLSGSTLTVPDSILTSIANQLASAVSATVGTVIVSSVQVIKSVKFAVPPFAVVHLGNNAGGLWVYVVRLNLTISNNTVTAATIGAYSAPWYVYSNQSTGIGRNTALDRLGANQLYDAGTAILIGVASPFGKSTIGSAPMTTFKFKYVKQTDQFVFPTNLGAVSAQPLSSNVGCHFAHPSLGFGYMIGDLSATSVNDFFTKLVFQPMAKTEAEFDSWTVPAKANWRVLASQEVAGGWIVYFTDETPLFMAGSLYSLIPTSIDLTTVSPDPANKTFYVYVQLVQGVPRYVIRETEAADSETSMYIGRITTTGSGIGQIDINKVDRIGTFRLSATPIGSAIPISSGHPADASTIAW